MSWGWRGEGRWVGAVRCGYITQSWSTNAVFLFDIIYALLAEYARRSAHNVLYMLRLMDGLRLDKGGPSEGFLRYIASLWLRRDCG